MADSAVSTVDGYLAAQAPERRAVLEAVRAVVLANLPDGYVETLRWGMVSYEVPLARFPDTYNGQPLAYAGLAAQKQHYALYLMGVYVDAVQERTLRDAYAALGIAPDLGKSCLRFKRLDQLPLPVIGELIAALPVEDYLARHSAGRSGR
jgi:uncharacterized protein YdhG (YjbR/CyaY superfamily)